MYKYWTMTSMRTRRNNYEQYDAAFRCVQSSLPRNRLGDAGETTTTSLLRGRRSSKKRASGSRSARCRTDWAGRPSRVLMALASLSLSLEFRSHTPRSDPWTSPPHSGARKKRRKTSYRGNNSNVVMCIYAHCR